MFTQFRRMAKTLVDHACIAEASPRHRQDMADAAGQPACTQVSRCTWLYGSDRKLPDDDSRPGMSSARRARQLAPRRLGPHHQDCPHRAGMARVRSGQALAWPLVSDRSAIRSLGSNVTSRDQRPPSACARRPALAASERTGPRAVRSHLAPRIGLSRKADKERSRRAAPNSTMHDSEEWAVGSSAFQENVCVHMSPPQSA
jgi:hypothetical protein